MKKLFTLKVLALIIYVSLSTKKGIAQVNMLSENFDNVIPSGWSAINHSTGSANGQIWFQGDVRKFHAYTGTITSYAAAGYQSIGSVSGNGTISNWLISPELNLTSGGMVSFYTRTTANPSFADRLEVRLSTNGTSKNVGSGEEGTGDFSNVLLTINPDLKVNGYPDTGWTQYTISLSGVNGAGRIAFRYYVTDAGSNGPNSNYIGIDEFSYESVLPVTLLNFRGEVKNNAALLTWSTANEINNKGFEVQFSRDNKNFSGLGFVAGNGNTPGISQYSFTDNGKLLSGLNYYRLKQIDNDGNSKYSPVIKLDFKKLDWKIFGNPYSGNTYIQLQIETQSNIAVQVISMNGKLIQTINKSNLAAGTYNIPLNLSGASRGIYAIKLLVDKNAYSKQIMR